MAAGHLFRVEIAETDQILTVAVECLPMSHVTNGILTAVGQDGRGSIARKDTFGTPTLPVSTPPGRGDSTPWPGRYEDRRVRFPSDDEWAERQRAGKVIVKHSGAGSLKRRSNGEESTPRSGEDPDRGGPEVDAFEGAEGHRAVGHLRRGRRGLRGRSFVSSCASLGCTCAPPEDGPPRRT